VIVLIVVTIAYMCIYVLHMSQVGSRVFVFSECLTDDCQVPWGAEAEIKKVHKDGSCLIRLGDGNDYNVNMNALHTQAGRVFLNSDYIYTYSHNCRLV
jgi:hypothetical protein